MYQVVWFRVLGPLAVDRDSLEANFDIESTRSALAALGHRGATDVLADMTAGPETLRQYVGNGQTISDRFPRIEYFLDVPGGRNRQHADSPPRRRADGATIATTIAK